MPSAIHAQRAALNAVSRRGLHSTRAQLSSPYHYPEGPRSNLPFNPRGRFFALQYWGFMGTAFLLPFAIGYWQVNKN
ncbi:hypothetical protein K470DRAFT_254377 [Piedraia hortae CBS 480.64]|uniref:Cytochrome c oxidase subunit 8, mitochondrial n=1 Tax=Piedraia hortae CBS 480.64 TaxID=1314780 RepID=A0A6A7C9D0_9PEZI|nr:hypothetical protein K470DRAFT_254377 [Piedraia hortae CBS 480.64]